MCSGSDEFHEDLIAWVKQYGAKNVCYESVLRHDVCGIIVDVRMELGTVTDDKSKVTCRECLEMIHA